MTSDFSVISLSLNSSVELSESLLTRRSRVRFRVGKYFSVVLELKTIPVLKFLNFLNLFCRTPSLRNVDLYFSRLFLLKQALNKYATHRNEMACHQCLNTCIFYKKLRIRASTESFLRLSTFQYSRVSYELFKGSITVFMFTTSVFVRFSNKVF